MAVEAHIYDIAHVIQTVPLPLRPRILI